MAAWRMKSQGRRQSTIQQNSRSPLPQKRSPFPPGRLQLLLDVKMCIFKVGEATELFFCLWSHKKKTFVAEDFCVYLTDAGMPEQIKLLNKLTTLYKVGLRWWNLGLSGGDSCAPVAVSAWCTGFGSGGL